MGKWDAAVPVVVAVIGVIGAAFLPVLAGKTSSIVNQLYSAPDIKIAIDTPEANTTVVTVSNNGSLPATNLTLILTMLKPDKINNPIFVTNEISTVPLILARSPLSLGSVTSIPTNQSTLEFHVKRFVTGQGSLIKLAIKGKDIKSTTFTAYASYDQGSMETIEGMVPPPVPWYESWQLWIILIITVAAFSIIFMYILVALYRWLKRRFLFRITEQAMEVRKKLQGNEEELYDLPFPYTLWDVNPHTRQFYKEILMLILVTGYATKLWRMKIAFLFYWVFPVSTRRIINDIKDYLNIDDFYSVLEFERDKYIRENQISGKKPDQVRLKKHNTKCLELAKSVLEKIDWTKYK